MKPAREPQPNALGKDLATMKDASESRELLDSLIEEVRAMRASQYAYYSRRTSRGNMTPTDWMFERHIATNDKILDLLEQTRSRL
jgi:hypothetical protein